MGTDPSTAGRERLKKELFDAALQLPEAERRAYLEGRAAGDRQILEAVWRMLASEATTVTGILDDLPRPRPPEEPRPAPLMFGPYSVIRRIGQGGMGTVYACAKDGDEQLVAAKVIRSSLSVSDFRGAFEQERQILTSVRHPNICHLLDAGIADGNPFFIMEYVEGERIDRFCKERRYAIRDRLLLVTQVLIAMEYLHGQNIIHRDLKPSNILVTQNGEVKILDFGIAKIVSHPAGQTGLVPTVSRNTAMTLRYASPEQLNHTLSGRSSDLYALGVITYELLTGRHPYERDLKKGVSHLIWAKTTRRAVPASLAEDPENHAGLPSRLREFPIRFRASLDQLLFNAMATDPSHRYRTAKQFLDDVRLCLDDRPIAML